MATARATTMNERWRKRGPDRARRAVIVRCTSVFPSPAGFLQPCLREYALAALAGPAAGEDALDRRDDGRPAEVGALVLEQRREVVALERVDQSDDLVGLQVV